QFGNNIGSAVVIDAAIHKNRMKLMHVVFYIRLQQLNAEFTVADFVVDPVAARSQHSHRVKRHSTRNFFGWETSGTHIITQVLQKMQRLVLSAEEQSDSGQIDVVQQSAKILTPVDGAAKSNGIHAFHQEIERGLVGVVKRRN